MKRHYSVGEAAKLKGCTRQAIHAAIKSERIEAVAEQVTKTVWKINGASLKSFTPNPNMKRSGRKSNGATD
jgi:hypothetical protein